MSIGKVQINNLNLSQGEITAVENHLLFVGPGKGDKVGKLLTVNTDSDLSGVLAGADGLIIATPVYKASFSGALKTLLDLLPERALEGKIVLPLATGGTIAHMLAVDYALKPVLNALKAQEILHGVFADDSQVTDYQHKPQFTANLQRRLDDALETFWQALHRPSSRAPSLTSLRGVEHA